jgi:hypothetical protein
MNEKETSNTSTKTAHQADRWPDSATAPTMITRAKIPQCSRVTTFRDHARGADLPRQSFRQSLVNTV